MRITIITLALAPFSLAQRGRMPRAVRAGRERWGDALRVPNRRRARSDPPRAAAQAARGSWGDASSNRGGTWGSNIHDRTTIDKFVDAVARSQGDDCEWCEQLRARLHKELDRQITAFDAMVRPFSDANDEADDRLRKCTDTLVETAPTTLAGLAALFACLRDNDSLREYLADGLLYCDKWITNFATATAKFAKQA
jgi:hypothetical protein